MNQANRNRGFKIPVLLETKASEHSLRESALSYPVLITNYIDFSPPHSILRGFIPSLRSIETLQGEQVFIFLCVLHKIIFDISANCKNASLTEAKFHDKI